MGQGTVSCHGNGVGNFKTNWLLRLVHFQDVFVIWIFFLRTRLKRNNENTNKNRKKTEQNDENKEEEKRTKTTTRTRATRRRRSIKKNDRTS